MSKILETIIQSGNRGTAENIIVCADGFQLSVIAGYGYSSSARFGFGPYTRVEVGYPSERPEPWFEWEEYRADSEIYAFVPVGLVRQLIDDHGGE